MLYNEDDTVTKISTLLTEKDKIQDISLIDSGLQLFVIPYQNKLPITKKDWSPYITMEYN